jgi:hypothetical protein
MCPYIGNVVWPASDVPADIGKRDRSGVTLLSQIFGVPNAESHLFILPDGSYRVPSGGILELFSARLAKIDLPHLALSTSRSACYAL